MRRLVTIGFVLCLAFTANAQSLLEKIATTIIADQFGIDTREVVYVQQQNHIPVWELPSVFEGSYYFKRSPNDVWRLRNQGLGWGQVAQRMGMHSGTFNKLRKQGAFGRDRFWIDSYSRRFNYPRESTVVLYKRAGTLQDVLAAIVIGQLSKRDPRDIYDQYHTARSWDTVADRYNVQFVNWQRVSRPVRSTMPVRIYIKDRPVPTSRKVKVKSNNGHPGLSHGKSGVSKGKSGATHGKAGFPPGKNKGQGHGQHNKGPGKGTERERAMVTVTGRATADRATWTD